jgi:5-formyltetrahydrofolate cyclo-ligase
LTNGGLDLIVVPGVGFDKDMNRVGHGKGYYDDFIQRCHAYANSIERRPPVLGITVAVTYLADIIVALALKAQMVEVDTIPMTRRDWRMDFIITDGELIQPSK